MFESFNQSIKIYAYFGFEILKRYQKNKGNENIFFYYFKIRIVFKKYFMVLSINREKERDEERMRE